jgi:hypothetical protein
MDGKFLLLQGAVDFLPGEIIRESKNMDFFHIKSSPLQKLPSNGSQPATAD